MGASFDERLAAVRSAASDPTSKENRVILERALKGKNGYLVGAAARAIAHPDARYTTLMEQAFGRLLERPVDRDPKCHGKVALAATLFDADVPAFDVFLAGIRHVQMEPVWGGQVDTAAELRGTCAMALSFHRHPRAMVALATLLADPERPARVAAANALGSSGETQIAEPLLRLRIETSEDDPEVVGACLHALLELAPEPSLAYASELLASANDETAEAACLAIGESRVEGGLPILRAQAEITDLRARLAVVLLAIALLRTEEAWAHLLDIVEHGESAPAGDALRALATFRHDESLAESVRNVVQRRNDGPVSAVWSETFGAAD